MSKPYMHKQTTLLGMVRKFPRDNYKCSTCHQYPWNCKCGRTPMDLVLWLQRVTVDLEQSVCLERERREK